MALYVYECTPNGHRFEVRHGMNESPVHHCLECRADVRRVITAPGIVFKGSGFYVTDSRQRSEAMSDAKPSSESGKSQEQTVSAKATAPGIGRDAKGTQEGPRIREA